MGPVSGMEISLKLMGNRNPMKRYDFCMFASYTNIIFVVVGYGKIFIPAILIPQTGLIWEFFIST